jgi:hypothetical protein
MRVSYMYACGGRAVNCIAAEIAHALRNDRDGKSEVVVFSETDTDAQYDVRDSPPHVSISLSLSLFSQHDTGA